MLPAVERFLRDPADTLVYFWRRNNWLLDPRCLAARFAEVEIDRPIFLVGNQGDGLTLVSRMLRRHPRVVSLSGDHRYWAGADEMHRAYLGRLPRSLTNGGRWLGGVPNDGVFIPPLSWAYAADHMLGHFRRTAADYDEGAARRLRAVLAENLYRHGRGRRVRFTDKSQTFTVRMAYVDALLRDTRPHFVLVTRDPWASCYRNAIGGAGDMQRGLGRADLDRRFEVCLQHWLNSMRCVEEDRERVSAFTSLRFEDFLTAPEATVERLCRFADLPYDPEMVPAAHHRVPFGSRFTDRWYPLRTEVNERYLAELPERFERQITERAGELAARYGYLPPRHR